jgi:uncharacterized membrane protein
VATIAVVSAIAVFVAAVAVVSIWRYESYMAFGDLTAFDQFFWNTLHGRLFESTYPWSITAFWSLVLNGDVLEIPSNSSYLGIHFEPGLLLLLPFYALHPSPTTLVALQAAFGGLAAIPLYLFSRDRLHSAPLGAAVAISYLLHPALSGMLVVDFHAQALLVFWLSLALWLVSIRRWHLVGLVVAIALLTNEVAALPLAALGGYIAVIQRRPMIGITLFGTSVAYFVIVTGFVIPHFSVTGTYMSSGYFNRWGGTPVAIAVGILTQPAAVLEYLTREVHLTYLFGLLAPTLFLAVLAPELCVIGMPALAGNLLANSDSQRILAGQYNATILAPLYFAMAVGLDRTIQRVTAMASMPRRGLDWITTGMAVAVVVAALLANSRLSYYPAARSMGFHGFNYPPNVEVLARLIAQIPVEASVATADNLSTHLTRHHDLHIFPVRANVVDYVILPTTDARIWPLTLEQLTRYLDGLRRSPAHEVVAEEGGYILIKRRPDAKVQLGHQASSERDR